MALHFINSTPRAVSAADTGLATGTAHLWFQIRIKGSFLLDKAIGNTDYCRFRFVDDPVTPTTSERFNIHLRKSTADVYNVQIVSRRDNDLEDRVIGWTIAIATLDALLDAAEWYTLYITAWPDGTNTTALHLRDSTGTSVWSDTSQTDGANVFAIGAANRLMVGDDVPIGLEIDGFAFGTGLLDEADQHLSPAVHGNALRYWLFEDGSGSTVVEGTGNGQPLTISGTENTDYEWIAGDWGAGAVPPTASVTRRIVAVVGL